MKRSIALFAVLALAAIGYAQTPAPTLTFTPGSEVVAFHTNVAGVPQWSVGNLTTESFDLIDFGKTKAQHFSIVGTELLAPTPGISMYHAGGSYVPNVTGLFSKTNIPSNTISFHVDGSIGITIPAAGTNHISWMGGGGFKLFPGAAVTYNALQGQCGKMGAQTFCEVSTGISKVFGH